MKKLLAVLMAGALFAPFTTTWALPVDLAAPHSTFGDANNRDGKLLTSFDLREADFGGGLRLPVRWVYRSANQATSPYGWNGFSLTVLESTAVKRSASVYQVTLPCGKIMYFTNYFSEWISLDHQWMGVSTFNGGVFTITRWDGWKLEYYGGHLAKLTTDDNRVLKWTFDSANKKWEISEEGHDPVVEVTLSNDPDDIAGSSVTSGYAAHKIAVNGDEYIFKYSDLTLQEIDYPDSRKMQWKLEDAGTNEKKLTFTDVTDLTP